MTSLALLAPVLFASFLASLVEAVEALTIVIAAATIGGWRPALVGAAAGLAGLASLVLLLGPLLDRVPLDLLQVAIGVLLLLFGLRWLRKAVLRAGGRFAQRDEDRLFESERASLNALPTQRSRRLAAGAVSFKAVLLEGLEVVFVVIAVGAGRGLLPAAALAALAACALVAALGFALRRPLAHVPENTVKFGVGVVLTSFGMFWTGEGLGITWPGADWAIPVLAAFNFLLAMGTAYAIRPIRERSR
jgi:uncharacterized membrane protein